MELPLTNDTRAISKPSPDGDAPHTATEEDGEQRYRTERRFDRAARLFGEPGLRRLMASRVLVIGVGGVGSFAAEALARSAVGRLVLIDFDKVCITNTNRQLHAMRGTIGEQKVEVMAERLGRIHPTGQVEAIPKFYNAQSSDELLSGRIDFVIDAIDNLTAKAHLIATAVRRGIPIVSSMGAAARMDPTQIRVDDLSNTAHDPFARSVRKILREQYDIDASRGNPIGVEAVYSTEPPIPPETPSYDEGVGFRCVCVGGKNGMHDCDRRARIDGTASFVTGSFGLAAASVVVRRLTARA